MKKNSTPIWQVFLINGFLFAVFFLLTHPVYDTQEDVYILYLLSGGFGNAPTELVHYNHILHPYLGILIKNLFLLTDTINWYTFFLLAAHFSGCSIIFYLILNNGQKQVSILLYLLLFIVFECRLLLTINFTNASIILGCAGLLLLLTAAKDEKINIKQLLYAGVLLLVASFFRIHVLIPVAGISIPFLLWRFYKRNLLALIITMLAITGSIALFNQIHVAYYEKHIPHWDQEETYRQKIYSFYNSRQYYVPNPGEKWFTEINLVKAGLPVDTNFLSGQKLSTMFRELHDKRKNNTNAYQGSQYWFWVNNRLLFCCTLLFLLFPAFNRKLAIASASSLFLLVLGLYWIIHNYKLPDYLLISSLFQFGLLTVIASPEYADYHKILKLTRLLLAIAFLSWGIVRIYKINHTNSSENRQLRLTMKKIAGYRDYLFINTSGNFPLKKYYIFDVPKKFKLTNFLAGEHFMNHIYQPAFRRFDVSDACELPINNRVLFMGKRVPGLETCFSVHCGFTEITFSTADEFNLEELYRLQSVTVRQNSNLPGH